jgi:hypothetical protein
MDLRDLGLALQLRVLRLGECYLPSTTQRDIIWSNLNSCRVAKRYVTSRRPPGGLHAIISRNLLLGTSRQAGFESSVERDKASESSQNVCFIMHAINVDRAGGLALVAQSITTCRKCCIAALGRSSAL